jgi:hypothetical protein
LVVDRVDWCYECLVPARDPLQSHRIRLEWAIAIALARHDGALPDLMRLLTFPIDAIGELGRGAGRREGAPPPFVLIAGQYVAWVALGYLGIDRATRPRGGGGPARRE